MGRRSVFTALPLVLVAGACTPYAVSTSALPMARGEGQRTTTLTVVPGGLECFWECDGASPDDVPLPSMDMEQRVGLDERSDIGVRITMVSGVVGTYKRRLDGPTNRDAAATSIMIGAGLVNLGQHAHGEVTLMTSGRQSARVVPYGGARAIQMLPLTSSAVHDTPTVGAFAGVKMGGTGPGVSAELAVFSDRSALGLRSNHFVIVPSVAFHGGVFTRKKK